MKNAAVIGLGYVGMPLVIEFCRAGFSVLGFDIDKNKIKAINQGRSYLSCVAEETIDRFRQEQLLEGTTDFSRLQEVQYIIIAVPTPLNKHREPDMKYVINTSNTIRDYLKPGQLVILESTTYPGTSKELLLPILEDSALKVGKDFFLVYSSERLEPNDNSNLRKIPKVIGGATKKCLERGVAFYEQIFDVLVPVSSTEVAEASKLLENIFRSVNIALVNEMKILFDRMGIDIWEVINAAATKPFGFMPFYPGPGLGGHCIPIDPFYLTWKAREYDFSTKFIELAGEINTSMPYYVVQKTMDALSDHNKSIKNARILILGAAYKKDVDDCRESPAIKIMKLLEDKGASISYNDPYVPKLEGLRSYPSLTLFSVELTEDTLQCSDCVVIVTDHSIYDYRWILSNSPIVVDTRNALKNFNDGHIYMA